MYVVDNDVYLHDVIWRDAYKHGNNDVVSLTTYQTKGLHYAANMDVKDTKRADDKANIYQEMAAQFLNVVIDNVAQFMKRKMAYTYSHIEQLILQRVASSYLKDIKEHISRIEDLVLENDGIKGDGKLLDTIESARRDIQMGYFKHLPEKIQLIDAGVADRKRRQIRMGRLERVLIETDNVYAFITCVQQNAGPYNNVFTTIIINLIDSYLFVSF